MIDFVGKSKFIFGCFLKFGFRFFLELEAGVLVNREYIWAWAIDLIEKVFWKLCWKYERVVVYRKVVMLKIECRGVFWGFVLTGFMDFSVLSFYGFYLVRGVLRYNIVNYVCDFLGFRLCLLFFWERELFLFRGRCFYFRLYFVYGIFFLKKIKIEWRI